MLNLNVEPVSKLDSLDLWRTKTNQLILGSQEATDYVQYAQTLDSQFRYIPQLQNGLNVYFRSGKATRKTVTKKIDDFSAQLTPNTRSLVYIDFYDTGNLPIKHIPIKFTLGATFPQTVQLGTANIEETDDFTLFALNGNELEELNPPLSVNVADPTDDYWVDYDNNTILFQKVPDSVITESFPVIVSLTLSLNENIKSYYTIRVTNDTTSVLLSTNDYTVDYDNDEITITNNAVIGNNITVQITKTSPIKQNTIIYIKSSQGEYISKPDIVPIYDIETASNNVANIIDLRTWAWINTYTQQEDAAPLETVYILENATSLYTFENPVDECIVYVDGVRYILDVHYEQVGTYTLKFKTTLPVGTKIQLITFIPANAITIYTASEYEVATVNGQTDFIIDRFVLDAGCYLWVNGIRQAPTAYTLDVPNRTITLSVGVPAGTVVLVSKNIFSNSGFVFLGGVSGQIAQKQSSNDDDWIWVYPEFDQDKFVSGKFAAARFPVAPWYFSDYNSVGYAITPEYLKYGYFFPASNKWSTNTIGSHSDYLFTGQNRNSFRGEGHMDVGRLQWTASGYVEKDYAYHEMYVCQKYGRIVRNPFDRNSFVSTDVPNVPFTVNGITATRQNPIPKTAYHVQTGYEYLIAVGDSGRIAYSINTIKSSLAKTARFERWNEISSVSRPFSGDWHLTDVASLSVEKPAQTGKTAKEAWDFVFVAAYNPVTNKSNVAWKLAVDIANGNAAWLYYHSSTGVTGKITNFASIDIDSAAVAWAINDKVFSLSASPEWTNFVLTRELTETKPVWNMQYTVGDNNGLVFAEGEVASKIHVTPTWDGDNSCGVFWSIATKPQARSGGRTGGRIYVRGGTSVASDTYYLFNPAKPYPANTPQNAKWNLVDGLGEDIQEVMYMACVGGVDQAAADTDARNRATFYFGDGCAKAIGGFDSQSNGVEIPSRVASGSVCGNITQATQFVHGKIVAGIEFQTPLMYSDSSYLSENLLVQNEQGDISRIQYRIGNTDVLANNTGNGYTNTIIPAFENENQPVPPVNMYAVVSNGKKQLCVAQPPVNCGWIIEEGFSGGTPVPFEGNVFGAFYEGNRFIVVTTKYIYYTQINSSGDIVWLKTQYAPNSNLVKDCDVTYTPYSGNYNGSPATGLYFMANGFDSALGIVRDNNRVEWLFYNKLASGNSIKPETILNTVVGFLGNATSGTVGFYDGYKTTSGSNIGTINPLSFAGFTIGCLSPVVENPVETFWKFNLRGLGINPEAIRSIKLIGKFRNALGAIDLNNTTVLISSENSKLSIQEITLTTSQSYGTTWTFTVSGANNKYMVAGNTYELSINDIQIGSITFDRDVPDRVVTSNNSGKLMGISVDGRLVQSTNGTSWVEIPTQKIKVFDLNGEIGESTTTVINSSTVYTSIQYNEFIKGYVCGRKNGNTVLIYDNGTTEEHKNYLNVQGSIYDTRPFLDDGEYFVDITGKKFILFGKTNIGRIVISLDGTSWLKLNSPIHSKDEPSVITYDNNGNHFITAKKINNKTGELPRYHRMKF
jgi:hypothetical protein